MRVTVTTVQRTLLVAMALIFGSMFSAPAHAYRMYAPARCDNPGPQASPRFEVSKCGFPSGSDEQTDVYAAFSMWNAVEFARRKFDTPQAIGSSCDWNTSARVGRWRVMAIDGRDALMAGIVSEDTSSGAIGATHMAFQLNCIGGSAFRTGATVVIAAGHPEFASAPRGEIDCYDLPAMEDFSVRGVIAHELGHVLGLDHEPYEVPALMSRYLGVQDPAPTYCGDATTSPQGGTHIAATEVNYLTRYYRDDTPDAPLWAFSPFRFTDHLTWDWSGDDTGPLARRNITQRMHSSYWTPELLCPENSLTFVVRSGITLEQRSPVTRETTGVLRVVLSETPDGESPLLTLHAWSLTASRVGQNDRDIPPPDSEGQNWGDRVPRRGFVTPSDAYCDTMYYAVARIEDSEGTSVATPLVLDQFWTMPWGQGCSCRRREWPALPAPTILEPWSQP